MAISLPFDCSVLGVAAPDRGENFQPTRKSVKDSQGKPTQETIPYELSKVPRMPKASIGHPLKSFHPSDKERKNLYVRQSFTVSKVPKAGEPECAAVAEMTRLALNDRGAFFRPPHPTVARETFQWEQGDHYRSKPCDFDRFDPDKSLIVAGVHAPLLVYVKRSSDGRRSIEANARRALNRPPRKPRAKRHGDGRWASR